MTWDRVLTELREIDAANRLTGKQCRKCGIHWPVDNFDRTKDIKSGRIGICKGCRQLRANERYRRNGEHNAKRRQERGDHIRFAYGLTPADIKKMLTNQNNCCGLCHKPFMGKWVVDHSHRRNKPRALLHYKCNIMLGYLETNPDLVLLVENYLQKFEGPTSQPFIVSNTATTH